MDEARLCPRCGVVMEYRVESEDLSDGTRRVAYYYKCPRCGGYVVGRRGLCDLCSRVKLSISFSKLSLS